MQVQVHVASVMALLWLWCSLAAWLVSLFTSLLLLLLLGLGLLHLQLSCQSKRDKLLLLLLLWQRLRFYVLLMRPRVAVGAGVISAIQVSSTSRPRSTASAPTGAAAAGGTAATNDHVAAAARPRGPCATQVQLAYGLPIRTTLHLHACWAIGKLHMKQVRHGGAAKGPGCRVTASRSATVGAQTLGLRAALSLSLSLIRNIRAWPATTLVARPGAFRCQGSGTGHGSRSRSSLLPSDYLGSSWSWNHCWTGIAAGYCALCGSRAHLPDPRSWPAIRHAGVCAPGNQGTATLWFRTQPLQGRQLHRDICGQGFCSTGQGLLCRLACLTLHLLHFRSKDSLSLHCPDAVLQHLIVSLKLIRSVQQVLYMVPHHVHL
mmetsp:Transcript_23127/g.50760  ORF Transcript_23127/g.50760 Transcript_23127/m.50760 type:complete len:375 (+) Transcript_23127:3802-4926(+)